MPARFLLANIFILSVTDYYYIRYFDYAYASLNMTGEKTNFRFLLVTLSE